MDLIDSIFRALVLHSNSQTSISLQQMETELHLIYDEVFGGKLRNQTYFRHHLIVSIKLLQEPHKKQSFFSAYFQNTWQK